MSSLITPASSKSLTASWNSSSCPGGTRRHRCFTGWASVSLISCSISELQPKSFLEKNMGHFLQQDLGGLSLSVLWLVRIRANPLDNPHLNLIGQVLLQKTADH